MVTLTLCYSVRLVDSGSDPRQDGGVHEFSFAPVRFPRLAARDLEGGRVDLPDDFGGEWNLVVVAFRRDQQVLVDSWIAWFEGVRADHPTLRCYEIPVLATRWSPARRFIDGGMAQAVRDPETRRRTLTVYTDVRRVTDALAIDDTSTITVLLVTSEGYVTWRATGSWTEHNADAVAAALVSATVEGSRGERPEVEQFAFAFEARFRGLLALLGITSTTAHVTLTRDRLIARFGPWTCETALANVRDARPTGPYRWFTAIGPRGSFADRGLTFGTTTAGGVCVLFHDPVRGLDPMGMMRHPGLTLTVAEPDSFIRSLRARAGLD